MSIVTRPATQEYRDNFDAVFGGKREMRKERALKNRMQEQVEEFHRKFGHTIGETPDIRRPELRAALILEEAIETVVGILGTTNTRALLRSKLGRLEESAPATPDLVEAIDGICDLLYVTFGTAIEFGVNIQPIFDEVHRTNIAKEGGATRPDGKTLKPPGWQPPRVAELIDEQRRH
ncbi:MAG: hypothetical protein JO277_00510 [Candidatus Eremiobacteraeota bacterium]|nr:hypothetical protein [Candidatus Eremiobacteraeota bacterium]MBV8720597.1 hypothetical protein [Candidatus Eremiobacteraeota bacterium]